MDYEKKYKEALERAKSSYENEKTRVGLTPIDLEYIFPELKESEDERIRKELTAEVKEQIDSIPAPDCRDKEDEKVLKQLNKWLAWLEKQGKQNYTKKDVDDAYLKGISDTKNEIEKQYEANYQIRKDIATFIFNYRGDIKDRAKWMDYLGIKVSFVEKNGEQPQGKSTLEAIKEEKVDNANKSEDTFGDVEQKVFDDLLNNGEQMWSEDDETGWTNTMIMIKECAVNHYTKDSIRRVVDWLESLKQRLNK